MRIYTVPWLYGQDMEIDILATLVENFEKCPPPLDQFLDTRLTGHDLRKIRKIVRINYLSRQNISKTILKQTGFPETSIATRNWLLRAMADDRVLVKRPPFTTRHKSLQIEWDRTFMKEDVPYATCYLQWQDQCNSC